MPDKILLSIILLLFLIYFSRKVFHDLHMMQLNSYMTSRYLRWMGKAFLYGKQSELFIPYELLLLGGIALLIMRWHTAAFIYDSIFYLLFIFLYQREKGKTPLVMTKRAYRLYSITMLLVFCIAVFSFYSPSVAVSFGLILLITWCSFFLLLFANILLIPVEKCINARYKRKAKRRLRSMPKLAVIGVTGSYGKTSVKNILGQILNSEFHTLISPQSFNTPMGLTRTVLEQLSPLHEVFVAEMGAKRVGDVRELCNLVNPVAGIITAIGEQHLETFKKLENIIKTKCELLEYLPVEGLLVANIDDNNIADGISGIPHKCEVIRYSLKGNGDYNIADLTIKEEGSSFYIIAPNGERQLFLTSLFGRNNVSNILGAVAFAHKLGISLLVCSQVVKQIQAVPHRLSLIKTRQGFTIIDDAFNSNPVGAAVSLEVLEAFQGGAKILITPGMVELGSKQDELNKNFARAAALVCDYIIFINTDWVKVMVEAVSEVGFPEENIFVADDLAAAKNQMSSIVKPGDVVLFENDLPDTYNKKNTNRKRSF